MARSNRLVVPDGCYHIVSRVAHRAHLLADDALKEKIVTWMYGIAAFCGVDILDWCILDNHIHILADIPTVPESLWLDPSTRPPTHAFSMRPPEIGCPRWSPTPSIGDRPSDFGDRPSDLRPETGFSLSDEAMIERLGTLYAGTRQNAESVAKRWQRLRTAGRDTEVDAEKDRFCRRMYNVSQFMKTLKQRISEEVNRNDHVGQLWEGRFFSGLVGDTLEDRRGVSAYILCNPLRAGLAKAGGKPYRWCAYGAACAGDERARRGYERLYGCAWTEARERIESVLADVPPPNYDHARDKGLVRIKNASGHESVVPLRVSQLAKLHTNIFSHAAVLTGRLDFYRKTIASLPPLFKVPGDGCIHALGRFDWSEPQQCVA